MKETHSHPGTEPPVAIYTCINCGTHNTIKGQWNVYAGRWLMSFDCQKCWVHQEAFKSEPDRTRTVRKQHANDDD